MKNPKVSVIMSVYNEEKYLREAIDSILTQTFQRFEFIIINDGSTDTTRVILEEYARKDKRIILINNTQNIGLTKSLNIGLRLAKYKYIARIDANDIAFPNRLEKQIKFLDKNKTVGLVSGYYVEMDEKGNEIKLIKECTDRKKIKEFLKNGNLIHHQIVIFRKECVDRIGSYREQFKYAQDYDLWLRLSEYFDIAIIDEPLGKIRVMPRSITYGYKKIEQDIYVSLARDAFRERCLLGEDFIDEMSEIEVKKLVESKFPKGKIAKRRIIARNYFNIGLNLVQKKAYKSSLKFLLRSMMYYPFEKVHQLYFIKLVFIKAPRFFLRQIKYLL